MDIYSTDYHLYLLLHVTMVEHKTGVFSISIFIMYITDGYYIPQIIYPNTCYRFSNYGYNIGYSIVIGIMYITDNYFIIYCTVIYIALCMVD